MVLFIGLVFQFLQHLINVAISLTMFNIFVMIFAVAQLVERATPGEEVLGLIPSVAARSLLVGPVSV